MGPLDRQLYSFSVVVLAGVAAGFLFDLLRAGRGQFAARWRWFGGVADLAYWLLTTAVIGSALLLGNWGDVRLYVALGLVCGGLLYFWLASPVLLPLTSATISWLVRAFLWAWEAAGTAVDGLIITPAVVAVRVGCAFVRILYKITSRLVMLPLDLLARWLSVPLQWAGSWLRRWFAAPPEQPPPGPSD